MRGDAGVDIDANFFGEVVQVTIRYKAFRTGMLKLPTARFTCSSPQLAKGHVMLYVGPCARAAHRPVGIWIGV